MDQALALCAASLPPWPPRPAPTRGALAPVAMSERGSQKENPPIGSLVGNAWRSLTASRERVELQILAAKGAMATDELSSSPAGDFLFQWL